MPYDATKMADWQISEAAEEKMKSIRQLSEEMGLGDNEVIPYGKVGRLNYAAIMQRLREKSNGKYIDVTAITPTPLGEGKTTTTIGLLEGLGKRGRRGHSPAIDGSDNERQGERGRRRKRAGRAANGVLAGADG